MGTGAIIATVWSWVRGWIKKSPSTATMMNAERGTWQLTVMAVAMAVLALTETIGLWRRETVQDVPKLVADTVWIQKYNGLFEKHILLERRYAETQDSLWYERRVRMSAAEAASAVGRRYRPQ
jgi:hypothetical protein